jgi:hypothetical protein
MKTLFKILFIFLALTGATTLLFNFTDIQLGHLDFFSKHGWIFLFTITFFPRLTLLVSGLIFNSIEFGGLIWWASFLFAPRLLVAFMATLAYWNTNKFLVIASWLVAMGGESSEKIVISNKFRPTQKFNQFKGTTIDAEFKVKE